MRAVGIDIAENAVAVAEIRQRFGAYTLRAANYISSSTPLVKDGLFINLSELTKNLRLALDQASPQAIKIGGAHFSVPVSVVFTHVFSFPRELDAKAIHEGIEVQFSEYFPFDMESAAYDWKVVQESDQTQMVLVAACDRQYVDQIVQLARSLQIEIAGIDIENIACSRTVLPELNSIDTALLVDLGPRVTAISIFGQEGLQSTLVLEIGCDKLNKLIADKFSITYQQADIFKHDLPTMDKTSQPYRDALELIYHHLHPVVEEIKRSIRFFEGSRKRSVESVIITGEGSRLGDIGEYLSKKIDHPVQLAAPLQRLKPQQLVTEDLATRHATAIGLALGGADRRFEANRYTINRYIDTSIL